NHTHALRGIFVNTAVSANTIIRNNFISIQSAANNQALCALENVSGATAFNNTVAIQNNTISNCANGNNTTGSFFGIFNNAATCQELLITGNTFSNVNTQATTGS